MSNLKDTTEYLEQLKEIQLSDTVRARIAQELSAYADFHTRVTETKTEGEGQKLTSGVQLFSHWISQHVTATVAVVVLIFVGGGVGWMSQFNQPSELIQSDTEVASESSRDVSPVSAVASFDDDRGVSAPESSAIANQTETVAIDEGENRGALGFDAAEDLAVDESSVSTSMLAEPIETSTIYTDTQARLDALTTLLERYETSLPDEVMAELSGELNEVGELQIQVLMQSNLDLAREAALEASDGVGQVEAALSLLGEVVIDPDTGAIVDIDL
ncbi:hypothetical protein N9L26_00815 [Candidatus Pacebacteria bacterium]|nr:hypothetical protein [Candidatus Paceibacterota bacterium]